MVLAIANTIAQTPGVLMLGWEADSDHNRSVMTFAGTPDAVVEAAVRGAGKAAELIDLSAHQGVHPRVGAADVIPFVPLEGSTMDEAVAAAHRAGEEIWRRYGVPVYFYERSARTPGRLRLEKVRRREFDGGPPDIGNLAAHPTAGASMVGARGFLVAYNVDLATRDAAIAQAIAKKIRASSGGFPHVKAMGIYLASRDCAQVSMNLTNFAETPLNRVYDTIASRRARTWDRGCGRRDHRIHPAPRLRDGSRVLPAGGKLLGIEDFGDQNRGVVTMKVRAGND